MNVVPIQGIAFDDTATMAMGLAFDQACDSLSGIGPKGREIIAKYIIRAASGGERDPARLYVQSLRAYRCGDAPTRAPISGGDRDFPTSDCALVERTACR